MLWDIFCRVIDNFGDVGVSWRLSADLAQRGQQVRLWVDDPVALEWMAPGACEGRWPGVQVLRWTQAHDAALLAALPPADVWVETFGCDIAPEFIAASLDKSRVSSHIHAKQPVWINLEYLSAEPYVERCHLLPSPVTTGPARGWTKQFFYPGFTANTGGLLREPDLQAQRAQFGAAQRQQWLQEQGLPPQGELLVSLFCYEPRALGALLGQLAAHSAPVRLLVTAGRASAAVRALPGLGRDAMTAEAGTWGKLQLHYLPHLTQTGFDRLLWACDLNFVRGEDSVVRALWAGKPFVWQIYPQEDGAHAAKLEAFLETLGADAALRRLHRDWNAVPGPAAGGGVDRAPLLQHLPAWQEWTQAVRQRLLGMPDLGSQLLTLAEKKR